MKNLMEEIDVGLQEFGLSPISDIVNNKEKSISYINRVLREYGNKVTIPFQLTLDKYDFRVNHVLFSFGLGIVLASFCNLKEKIEQEYEKYKIKNTFIYTWLTLCLYHDFGYFIGLSYLRTDNIKDLLLDHYIFDYSYCKSRYISDFRVFVDSTYSITFHIPDIPSLRELPKLVKLASGNPYCGLDKQNKELLVDKRAYNYKNRNSDTKGLRFLFVGHPKSALSPKRITALCRICCKT